MNTDIKTTKLFCTSQRNTNIIRISPLYPSLKSNTEEKEGEEEKQTGRWTRREHKAFIKGRPCTYLGLKKHGKQWKELQKSVPTRTVIQIRTHAQKFFIKLEQALPKGTDLIKYLKKTPSKSFVNIVKDFNDPNSKPLSSSFSSSNSSTTL